MTQQSFDLRAIGYREPSVESPSYPYLPVEGLDDSKRESDLYWLRAMLRAYGPGSEGAR